MLGFREFNLNLWNRNKEQKVFTRDGREVTDLQWFGPSAHKTEIAFRGVIIDYEDKRTGYNKISGWYKNGNILEDGSPHSDDLMLERVEC